MKITKENIKEAMEKKLVICNNKGFHIKLKNGWTISVQFGVGNYCENYDNDIIEFRDIGKFPYASDTAEIWAWNSGKHYPEDPLGYQTPEQILKFINKISKKKNEKTKMQA